MEKKVQKQLHTILMGTLLLGTCCLAFSQPIPQTSARTLRERYNAPRHTAKARIITRAILYKKYLRGECSKKEKAQVRAHLKKAGKRAGALLIAAAVAVGVGCHVLYRQYQEQLERKRLEREKLDQAIDRAIEEGRRLEEERRAQEHAERVRRTYEQLQREEEEFRREHLAREQLQQERAGRIRLEQLRRVQREREQQAQRERFAQAQQQREREEQRAAQSTRQKQREEMERKRQARLARYQEDEQSTIEPSVSRCVLCDTESSNPLPCTPSCAAQKTCCTSCIRGIQNIGTLQHDGHTIDIKKPCPHCRRPLQLFPYYFDPTNFPYQLDENSARTLWERHQREFLLQQAAAFLQQREGRRLATPPQGLSRYAYHP